MGMSGDFENAIREGATLVRIGTAIYGDTSERVVFSHHLVVALAGRTRKRRYLVVKTKYRQFFLSHSCTAAPLCQ